MKDLEILNALKDSLDNIASKINSLKTDVDEVSNCIETKRNISESTSNRIISALREINELNDSFKKMYNEISSEEELPDSLVEVESLITKAIEDYELNNKLSAYRIFLRLYSSDSKIMELLTVRKKDLRRLLDNYDPEFEKELVPYSKFVEAISETDPTKLVSYVAELTPVFGNELVGAALFTKNIFVSDEESGSIASDDVELETDVAITSDNVIFADNKVISAVENEALEQNGSDDNLSDTSAINDLFPEGFIESIFDSAEKKRFGTKIFINDMNQRNVPSNVNVMSAVDNFGAVTTEMIAAYKSAPFSLISDSIQYLCKKGYLREYGIAKIGQYFCASPKGIKVLHARDARGFLKLKGTTSNLANELQSVTVGSVLARLTFTKIISALYTKGNTDFYISHNVFNNEYFYSILKNKDSNIRLILAGIYLTQSSDLEAYYKEVSENLDNNDLYYVISGANDELAKNNADLLVEKVKLEPGKVLYYSLIDNELRKYVDDEPVTFSVFEEQLQNDELNEVDNQEQKVVTSSVEAQKESIDNNIAVEEDKIEKDIKDEIAKPAPANVEPKKESITKTSIDDIYTNMYQMIISEKTYCATTYIRSLSDISDEYKTLYEQLAYAVNVPWMKCSYNSHKMFQLYSVGERAFSDYLLAAASLRNFFMNHISYDYDLKQLQDYIKKSNYISSNSSLMNAMYKIALFKDEIKKGMDYYADYRIKDQVETNKKLESLSHEASLFYDLYINKPPKNHKGVRRFIDTWKRIFAPNRSLALSLRKVMDNDIETLILAKEYISESFITNDCSIDYSNLDLNKLNAFIDENWNSTYGATGSQYKTSNLMSDLRNNLKNAIEKVLKLICEWIEIVEVDANSGEDSGYKQYWESKKVLIEELEAAYNDLAFNENDSEEEKAGKTILKNSVEEILRRINGEYSEIEHKYYYIDFLRGNFVWLDDSYFPDMHGQAVDLPELSLPNRIIAHSKSNLLSFEEKLDNIFENSGDDYGSADLIINYLKETQPEKELKQYDIAASLEFAKEEAKLKLDGFIENLELAQSYGQIDESKENIKEKISGIAHNCYQYAVETQNYSFLSNVLNGYTKKIREDAKIRGRALKEEILKIKSQSPKNEARVLKIQQIESMIDEQKYTVAEDLLSRINDDESIENYEVPQNDYLKKFIDEYDYNYKLVVDVKKKISDLVSARIHNKDERGARRLADNWMSNGANIGPTKLANLLDSLGFSATNRTIKEQPKINGKRENYLVTIKNALGVKPNYKHPIAAFGSKAAESGFRIVCLSGKFSADELIEEFKNISGGKNTIVLLDYALSLNERRRLARKTKSDMGDKVFAVVDRVLLMFLVNNYNGQFINQILMSTMIPFSYCQPYVWDSSKVMPPEIFVGRKEELEKIESPQGVNIVYGGRQLGKSALLKMAKMDIDYSDERQNRAVYIEIKGLDFKKAAKKIGHELFDNGILMEDIDTEDWDDLARIIKRRLTDSRNERISYLLLLLDEADTFIESCESVSFHPLDTLKDIQSVGSDRFKFVIAGLHNIVRFKRDVLSNNSVLTHLSSITIKPFTTLEALQLLKDPLYYLGLRFPNDRDVSLILANTNYFPGLIQLYCANLVDAMRKDDYAGYSQGETPAYDVTTKHFKKVLSDPGFTDQVREKFEITLKLDEDNMYYILALLVAYLYHQDSLSSKCAGVTPDDVISAARELSINKVANQSSEVIEGYMQELKELNIFRQTIDNLYLFSRYSFFQMMGTIDDVENKLMDYMED